MRLDRSRTNMTETQRYAHCWRTRQRHRITAVALVVLLFVYFFAFDWLFPAPRTEQIDVVFFAGLFVWAAGSAANIALGLMFRCPRCGKYFNLSSSFRDYTAEPRRSCIHCQLPVGALPK